jgi:hypothetical protein
VANPHEQGNLKKWTMKCKIHSKQSEEDAETTVMKAQELKGQHNIPSSFTSEPRAAIEDNQNSTILFGMDQWKGDISGIYSLLGME